MPDQLLLYHTAVLDFVVSEFENLIVPKPMPVMIGTPARAFAEYVTPTMTEPDGRPYLPRAAITLEDPEVNHELFNPGTMRKLGYTDANEQKLYRAKYPTPIKINYTLNFWTEYRREMNIYIQHLLKLFGAQYHYISVDIDSISPTPVYGTKDIGLFSDGSVGDTGDLEPGNKERLERRTFQFHMKAWLWDFDFLDKYSIKDVETSYFDKDSSLLWEVQRVPQRQILFTGNGSLVSFSGSVNPNMLPIVPNTFLIDATVGGDDVRGFDNGTGDIVGTGIVSGTVDYATGAIAIEYATAPDDATSVVAGYFTTV